MISPKEYVQHVLRRFGYTVHRVRPEDPYYTRALLETQTGNDAEYYRYRYTRWPMYAGAEGDKEFLHMYDDQVTRVIAGDRDRGYLLYSFARQAAYLPGDFAECGVFQGGSALLLCRILVQSMKKLFLFDSFQGLPQAHPLYDPYFREGQMKASGEAVRRLLSDFESFTEIREGWMPTTFEGLEDKQFAFVHVDVDLYQSTRDCFRFYYPRLVLGGILLFDEYGYPSTHGQKRAVDECLADKPERPIVFHTGQALVIKVSSV